MNPLFGKPQMLNPMQKIGQVVNDVRMLQQNPGQLGQYMADHGMINKDQMAQMGKMTPSQAGQYLMQNGIMPQQSVQQAYQNIVPMVKNNL